MVLIPLLPALLLHIDDNNGCIIGCLMLAATLCDDATSGARSARGPWQPQQQLPGGASRKLEAMQQPRRVGQVVNPSPNLTRWPMTQGR